MNRQLLGLIREQSVDDRSNTVTAPKGWPSSAFLSLTEAMAEKLSYDQSKKSRISWGQPAQLCEAFNDRHCPVCGKRVGKSLAMPGMAIEKEHFQTSYKGRRFEFWCPGREVQRIQYKLMQCVRPLSVLKKKQMDDDQECGFLKIMESEFSY